MIFTIVRKWLLTWKKPTKEWIFGSQDKNIHKILELLWCIYVTSDSQEDGIYLNFGNGSVTIELELVQTSLMVVKSNFLKDLETK